MRLRFGLCLLFVLSNSQLAIAQDFEIELQSQFDAALAAVKENRHDDAIAAFKRCLELHPSESTFAYNIACEYSIMGQIDQGIEWLEQAATLRC